MLLRLCLIVFSVLHFTLAARHSVREIGCECGLKNDGTRHKEPGKDFTEFAGNHSWPWMISIVNVSIPEEPVAYCGGSLINDRYVLTAAHCIPDMNDTGLSNFRIYLGTNLVTNSISELSFLNLGIDIIKSHPKFDFDTADYDVALIRLSDIVTFSKWVRPVCLRQHKSFVGKVGIITGWGSFNLTTQTEEELKETDVQVVSNELCRKNYSTVDIPVTSTMLCAALPGQDPCKGDSGGPLILRDTKNKFNQIGIISHGEGCSVPNFPAIFSRVGVFIDWIVESTQDALFCRGTF